MKHDRFDWQYVPNKTVGDIEQSASKAGHVTSYRGGVLYVYNHANRVWLQFMMMDGALMYRRVPGQMRAGRKSDGPSFVCDACGWQLNAEHLAAIAIIEHRHYNVCDGCMSDNVIAELKAAGLKVRVE